MTKEYPIDTPRRLPYGRARGGGGGWGGGIKVAEAVALSIMNRSLDGIT